MWAIQTKYLGPTDHKGSRIKAWFGERGHGMSVVLHWADELNVTDNHRRAAEELRRRMVASDRWGGMWAKARLLGADVTEGMVFVFSDEEVK